MKSKKKKNPAAVALGSIRTKKKARTSAENGKKGGRPRKVIDGGQKGECQCGACQYHH